MNLENPHIERDRSDTCFWPIRQLELAIHYLAQRYRWMPASDSPPPLPTLEQSEDIDAWLNTISNVVGMKADPLMMHYSTVKDIMKRATPALFIINIDNVAHACIVMRSRREKLYLLGTDLHVLCRSVNWFRSLHCEKIEGDYRSEIDEFLQQFQLNARKKQKAREILLQERIGDKWLANA